MITINKHLLRIAGYSKNILNALTCLLTPMIPRIIVP